MSAPTLTANVIPARTRKRRRRAFRDAEGSSDPDSAAVLLRADLSPLIGATVQVTVCVAGQRTQYRGLLRSLLPGAEKSGKGRGLVMEGAYTPSREVGELTVALRWVTNCVEIGPL
jgi:hypothetical protein